AMDTTIWELFVRQAHATPVRPAVTCDGNTLSYGELHDAAAALAAGLVAGGAGPGDPVAGSPPPAHPAGPGVLARLGVRRGGRARRARDRRGGRRRGPAPGRRRSGRLGSR